MKKSIILSLTITFSIILTCFCQPGILNPYFGTNGIVTTGFGTTQSFCTSMILQPDNCVLVAGLTYAVDSSEFALMRYSPEGLLDNTFGSDGTVITNLGTGGEFVMSSALAPENKIVLAGFYYNVTDPKIDIAVARYNTDGTLDPSFNGNGKVLTDFNETNAGANSVAVQQDGKIVIVVQGEIYCFALIRYNTDGSLDNSFSYDGKVLTYISGVYSFTNTVAIQPDGKIVAAGVSKYITSDDMDITVVRYNPDGTLDNSFSVDGIVITSLGEYRDEPNAIAIQPDGKILIAGQSNNGANTDVALVRYNPDGTLDLSFNQNGKVTTDIDNTYNRALSMVVLPDEKILISGTTYNGTDDDILLIRYNPDGTLDPIFGDEGIVITDIDNNDNDGRAVALSETGDIVVAGSSFDETLDYSEVFIACYYTELSTGIINFTAPENTYYIYPNPIEDFTVLKYELSRAETISIELYDIHGRLIQTFLSQEKRSEGTHEEIITLNNNIPPGNYLLVISNNLGSQGIRINIQ